MSESTPQKKTIRSQQSIGVKSFYPNSTPLSVNIKYARILNIEEEPLSPINQIFLNFEKLKQIQHKNLCKFIDIVSGKHGILLLIKYNKYNKSINNIV